MGLCSERHLRNKLKDLQGAWGSAMINYVKYGKEGGGSKPYYYYLTKYGKQISANVNGLRLAKIKSPSGHPKVDGDYEHRFQQISFLIALYEWAAYSGIEVECFEQYFEWTRGRKGIDKLESLTRLYLPEGMEQQFIDPDGVCILGTEKGRKLYLFELHRGHDGGRLMEQLKVHRVIIKKGIAMKKYGSERNSRLIVVCERKGTEQSVLKRLVTDETFRRYKDYYLFKNLEEQE